MTRKMIANDKKSQVYFPTLRAKDTPLSPNSTKIMGPMQHKLAITPPINPNNNGLLSFFIFLYAFQQQGTSCLHNRKTRNSSS